MPPPSRKPSTPPCCIFLGDSFSAAIFSSAPETIADDPSWQQDWASSAQLFQNKKLSVKSDKDKLKKTTLDREEKV
ncbi:hypothetical protein Taro_051598 [Colocasia esculenta]|uniref:Uncharacterized protein n=1 Tax=Colocasia esculenta TaxID=4460 RepID=A0A843XH86_COLES|nr:hypothetical protein [Colocasia esculenta]